MTTVSIEEARFTERLVAGKYKVKMPYHLTLHDRWDVWERERFADMEATLKPGDVLFDIGAETGEMSAIYAQFVGAENMVLFESCQFNWQTIKATWDANGLCAPLASVCALIGNENGVPEAHPSIYQYARNTWLPEACTNRVYVDRTFWYLHENAHQCQRWSIDRFVEASEIVPKAITMDCEGVEVRILEGAAETLRKHQPIVWASLHPDAALRDYNSTVEDVFTLMEGLGYKREFLVDDHEQHWKFIP